MGSLKRVLARGDIIGFMLLKDHSLWLSVIRVEALRFIQEQDDGDWVVVEFGGSEMKSTSRSIC